MEENLNKNGKIERTPERLKKEQLAFIAELETEIKEAQERGATELELDLLRLSIEVLTKATPEQINKSTEKILQIRNTQVL